MPRIDNRAFYINAIKLHGETPRGLNWTSSAHQSLRFDKIVELLPEDISSLSIADAGCGFGDFYHYLINNTKTPQKYIGIDTLQEMCEIATRNTAQEILCRDICKEELPLADYYVCSGALNILTHFESVQFIQNCYRASNKGFIFNLLHGEKESDTFNYLSNKQIQKIAKDLAVTAIVEQAGYLENDITLHFVKDSIDYNK